MPMYYSDPADEPRECLRCEARGIVPLANFTPGQRHGWIGPIMQCGVCNGTGRLSKPGARPDISTSPVVSINGRPPRHEEQWVATASGNMYYGATESEALKVARAVLKDHS